MEIIWLGHSCFRLRSREGTVVTDPCDKSTGYTIGRPTADIVTVSRDDVWVDQEIQSGWRTERKVEIRQGLTEGEMVRLNQE